jgi:hypothetical protein
MLRSKWFLWISLVLLLAVPHPGVAQQGEKNLYKLGLVLGDEIDRRQDSEALNAVAAAFVAARRFTMVERKQLDAILTEKNLQEFIGGKVNNKLSDLLGLDLVGVVSYRFERSPGEPGPNWILEVRLVDVKTATVLATLTSDRPGLLSPTTPREAGDRLFQAIREAFPPIGHVVQINDEEILVNLGSDAGVKNGDTLEVVVEGEQIPDPATGQLLSGPMRVVGELKVVSTSAQLSYCKQKSRGEVAIANLVRLHGQSSRMMEWLQKAPRVKDRFDRMRSLIHIRN